MSFFDDITGGRDLLRRSILRLRLLFLPATGGLHIGDNTLDAEADSGGNIDPFWKRADGTSSNLSTTDPTGTAGGELGGTYPNPTVDSTHSGSAHHGESHALSSHSSRPHSELSDAPSDAHHTASHTVASHSDTTGTGAELNTLTDTSDADSLHAHTNHGVTHNAAHTLASHSAKAHADLSDAPADAHHAESHTIASHSDTTSGTYTPTLTNGTNVAASTAYESQFIRVGAIVCVSGKVDVDPTNATATTILGVSLPVSSTIGAEEDVSGTCGQHSVASVSSGSVVGSTINDIADLHMHPSGDGNAAWSFIFQYQII